MKFGGSSVANAERFKQAAKIVKARLSQKPVLVLSAMGDTTDHLLEAADAALKNGPLSVEPSMELITGTHLQALQELEISKSVPPIIEALLSELGALLAGISLIRELSPRSKDFLVSFGERLSVRVAELYFKKLGVACAAFDAWEAGIISCGNFGGAEIDEKSWKTVPKILCPKIESGLLPIVTGFIAKSADGAITTLGRGGSDLTATFIAAACGAQEAQVWKDVDGIMTFDPRKIATARPVAEVSYDEAAELAYFGSQVLHPRAMLPCRKTGTPVLVKNSYNPDAPGTKISARAAPDAPPVRALTSKKDVTVVDIVSAHMLGQSGFLGEVFAAFARHKISVDMVATSEVSVSVTLDSSYKLDALIEELRRVAHVETRLKKSIVTIVCDVASSSKILERAFSVFGALGIQVEMISQGASKVNISFIVSEETAGAVIRGLHAAFFES